MTHIEGTVALVTGGNGGLSKALVDDVTRGVRAGLVADVTALDPQLAAS